MNSRISPYKALLLAHETPGVEELLKNTYATAARLAGLELDAPGLSVLKRARVKAQGDGTMITRRAGKHYTTILTDAGLAWLESESAEPEPERVLPVTPYRINRDHLMPRTLWKALEAGVKAGEFDLLVVRPGAVAKVECWDELNEGDEA